MDNILIVIANLNLKFSFDTTAHMSRKNRENIKKV